MLTDESAPISIDSAVSMLLAKDTPAKNDAPAASNDAPAQNDTPAATNDAPAANDTPAADAGNDTPATDDAQASQASGDEQGSLPPIEAPASWKAEKKEFFKSLPREAQEEIARREQDRDTETRRLQNTTAEERKAISGEVSRLKGLSDRMDGYLKEQVNDIAREFPEIKTQADIEQLAAADPGRFARFQASLMRFNAAQQAKVEAEQALNTEAQKQQRETMKMVHTELVKHFPTWKDANVAAKETKELQDYAISIGANEQGARALHDPIIYRLAQKAMLYDRAQAAKAAAVNREAPRTVQPGATSATPKADRNAAARKAANAKLDKSGDIMDALALIQM